MKAWLAAASLSLAFLGAPSAAHPGHAPATVDTAAPQWVEIPAKEGRKAKLEVWTAQGTPKGVVIFGHGMGGTPEAYGPLLRAMVDRGYSVVAPLAPDSLSHSDHDKTDAHAGFIARVEDLMIARGYAAKRFPGQRQALAGHSYGSLFAMIGGGAATPAGDLKGPPVAAILTLSSPGSVPKLVGEDTFRSITAPMMMVTGTHDLVPEFVTDWHDHRRAFDTSAAGDKYLLTVKDGGHDLMIRGDATVRAELTADILAFLDAYVAGDASAKASLAKAPADPRIAEERR